MWNCSQMGNKADFFFKVEEIAGSVYADGNDLVKRRSNQ